MLCALVGMPGSGKSTVGRMLARRLGVSFVDSDQRIEQRLGCSIREFFEREGEARFRDVEQDVIDELARVTDGVLATGGGTVLRPANRECLRATATVFYLRAAPEGLYRRLRHDRNRPLLQVEDPLMRLKDLYAARDGLYRETAHYVIDTGRPSIPALVQRIMGLLGRLPQAAS
jgi:shikimate kinase